jgi:AraC-like DNA-binding protein
MMMHTLHRPRPPLDRLVESLWVSEAYIGNTQRQRVLPTGAQALVIPLGESPVRVFTRETTRDFCEISGAIVCGARSSPMVIGGSIGPTVGVLFRPGGARAFFDVPADALAERATPLEALWGRSAGTLRERLMQAATPADRVHLVQDALLESARHSFELPAALRMSLSAFEEADLPSVAEVNRRTGLSPKRLLELFRAQVGLSPKAFWRVRRFRAALEDLGRGALQGATLASVHGYFDQAHFIREFRALAGSSPREYLAARIANSDHVSI